MSGSTIYYSPYLAKDGKFTVITWQEFDFYDYDSKRFLKWGENDKIKFAESETAFPNGVVRFEQEDRAIVWMLRHILPEYVDEVYLKEDNTDINTYLQPEFRSE